ncbi:hypothetical protein HMPREF0569_1587 [Micrococcus luteus SK58]|uniref:hypothetical protein n=1 Tax=Micrococcus luteus TaxID=1270 RepID=UPI0001C4FFE1|nr:hypothetical protein [Micrococcus luteus]EFD50334.1 hypothetical protein HMPREF0569_1587 [Micrococcus luteus SK58]
MTDRTATGEAREALDDLHLAAHENGPTTDLSTHFRRARRLWVTVVGEHHMAYGEPVPAWDELGASMQFMLTGFVARAVQDVLEVEQVMYRALSAALDLADRWTVEAHQLQAVPRRTGQTHAAERLCAARELRAALAGVEGEG